MDFVCTFVFKPNRIVYYIVPTEDERNDYLRGVMPEVFKPYSGAYGTYCFPSLYVLTDGGIRREVIGMEFRPDDGLVAYPDSMDSFKLDSGFMITANLPTKDYFDGVEDLDESAEFIRTHIEGATFHDGLVKALKKPEVVIVDTIRGSGKIYYEAEKVEASDFFDEPELMTENERRLYRMSYYDLMTDHPNWNYIWPIIAGYGLKNIPDYAFVHFDVKDFKAINVVYGHQAANDVLTRIAAKLKQLDWVYESARCDNDNFAMMIKDMPLEDAISKLEVLFNELSVLPEDSNYHIYYRCGYVPMRHTVLLGDRVVDAGKHVQRLGNKLYETEIHVYTDEMYEMLDWAEKTKAYLDTAIEKDEFLVYLQPKYDIRTNRLHGAEALIRWNYRGKELLSPGRFIPIFETGGLISKLDDIVLCKVCGYLRRWKSEGKPLLPISVNLSRKSLGNPTLIKHLAGIVDAYGVDHSLIEFELTESAAYDNQDYMITVLKGLKSKGFKISMDDFGTGYSSLALLTTMPLDTLKIAKSFVDNIGDLDGHEKDRSLIKHIISMSKDIKVTCLAEGAEEKEQVDALYEYGCEVVQGFYFSKPLPVEEYEVKAFGD